jgi:hypothetical protein
MDRRKSTHLKEVHEDSTETSIMEKKSRWGRELQKHLLGGRGHRALRESTSLDKMSLYNSYVKEIYN